MTPLYQTLAKTKAVLLERGWGREWVENKFLPVESPKAGCVCLATAVALACGYEGSAKHLDRFLDQTERAKEAVVALDARIRSGQASDFHLGCLVAWNDRPERNGAEVLKLVQEVADAHAL